MSPLIIGVIVVLTLLIIIIVVVAVRRKHQANAAAAIIADQQRWRCVPGIACPIRYYNGDIQCMSVDGVNCMWQADDAACAALQPPANVNPLACGADSLAKWGSTGYDDPNHWCFRGKNAILGTSA